MIMISCFHSDATPMFDLFLPTSQRKTHRKRKPKANHADIAAHFAIAAQSSIIRSAPKKQRSVVGDGCGDDDDDDDDDDQKQPASNSAASPSTRQPRSLRLDRMRASDVILPQGFQGRRLSAVLGDKQLETWPS